MMVVPVVALVDPLTLEALRPSLDVIVDRIQLNETQKAAGWTPEALALGVILARFAEDFDVVAT